MEFSDVFIGVLKGITLLIMAFVLLSLVMQIRGSRKTNSSFEKEKKEDPEGWEKSQQDFGQEVTAAYWRRRTPQEEQPLEGRDPESIDALPPMVRVELGTFPSIEARYFGSRKKKVRKPDLRRFHYSAFGAPRRRALA